MGNKQGSTVWKRFSSRHCRCCLTSSPQRPLRHHERRHFKRRRGPFKTIIAPRVHAAPSLPSSPSSVHIPLHVHIWLTSHSTAPPPPKQHLASTQDLLARFHLLPAYDRYVRPFTLPGDDPALQQQPNDPQTPAPGPSVLGSSPAIGPVDKGKGRERDSAVATPAEPDPADVGDADDDDAPGAKGEKKKKNTYRHLIKGIPGVFPFLFLILFYVILFLASGVLPWLVISAPSIVAFERTLSLRCRLLGKHSLKKDDYLSTMMLVPPKQRMRISHFDTKTQEDAFTVSLEGLKGVCHFSFPLFTFVCS